tara:strand:+ start:1557 stop:2264 length:708 start_codon:yes stop_codon:yes gene_type:complete
MRIAIMQPYFFPYLGYFKLINAVDKFVVYDDVEYTKKGWINRNRLLFGNEINTFSIPIRKSSDYDKIKEKFVSDDENGIRLILKNLRLIDINYNKSKYFNKIYPMLHCCFTYKSTNLFDYLHNALITIIEYLEINSKIIVSSDLNIDNQLKKEDKVISICKSLNCTTYINAIGGLDIYNSNRFNDEGISLKFLKSNNFAYNQDVNEFYDNLSIIDTLMHVSKLEIMNELNQYNLV